MLYVPQMNFFQHASKTMDARRKILNCTKATWNAFHACGRLPVSRFQSDFLTKKKKHSVAKKWSWENCLHGKREFFDFGSGLSSPSSDSRKSFLQWVGCSWAMYGFFRACPKRSSYDGYQLTSNLKISPVISHGSENCLCIGVQAYFCGWCNANPDFGIWRE